MPSGAGGFKTNNRAFPPHTNYSLTACLSSSCQGLPYTPSDFTDGLMCACIHIITTVPNYNPRTQACFVCKCLAYASNKDYRAA